MYSNDNKKEYKKRWRVVNHFLAFLRTVQLGVAAIWGIVVDATNTDIGDQ